MSEFFKNRRFIAIILGLVFVITTTASGYLALATDLGDLGLVRVNGKPESSEADESVPPDEDDEEEPDDSQPVDEPVHFNLPGQMRGVFLVPGTDYLATSDVSRATVEKEIDKALDNIQKLTMNSVIIDTSFKECVIYDSADANGLDLGFDVCQYIIDGCRERGLYTYVVMDASHFLGQSDSSAPMVMNLSTASQADSTSGGLDKLAANVAEFAEVYEPDAVLIDGYYNQKTDNSYPMYLMAGGSIGFENYMRLTPRSVVKTVSDTLRTRARGVQVGLLTDAVWENSEANEQGSNTKASFTALGTGNADTRAFVEENLVDFVAVRVFTSTSNSAVPFKAAVEWWSDIAADYGLPMYVVHASSNICTDEDGWASHDQLAKQVIEATEFTGFSGSIFNNLSRLSADPNGATTTLVKLYKAEVKPEHILTELAITKPDKQSFTTYEPVVTFTGASDPNSPVTINGNTIPTDASGYFTVTYDLKGGSNKFTISHKEKTLNYDVTRQVQILKSMDPLGSINTDGNMDITISAMAYSDAEVYATVGGTTVSMSIDETATDMEDRDSNYKKFVGIYTAPVATTSEQSVGNIVVTATWNGEKETKQGASVKVNKKAKIEDGVPVVVVANQAKTYPPNTLNNIPTSNYYPLPKGAMDYAVGDEVVYKKDGKTYTYTILASGMRVESQDIQAITNDYAGDNVISGMTVASENGYTNVVLKTAQKVTYSVKYTTEDISFTFHNTNKGTDGMKLSSNPIFSQASWNGSTLTLKFNKSSGFMGYKGYYNNDGNLVLRFNNPPSSMKNARIVVDPGHGGKDVGALGFLADYPEKVLNASIAKKLAAELESRGATVLLLDTSGNMELATRVQKAEEFNAHLMISVHNNTAANSAAAGTEIYYFYPYSYNLAINASKNVSNALSTNNRGAKYSYYHMTLSSQVPSILAECGFMTNKNEYEKLISGDYQSKIAKGLADAASGYIQLSYSGSSASGTQSSGSNVSANTSSSSSSSSSNSSSSSSSGSSGNIEAITFDEDEITLKVNGTKTLKVLFEPSDSGSNSSLNWKSSNSSVATVTTSGKVTAVKAGTCKITATEPDSGEVITCYITVTSSSSSDDDDDGDDDDDDESSRSTDIVSLSKTSGELYFDQDYLTIYLNSTATLEVYADEGLVTATDLTWYSDDDSIASVNKSGKITAKKAGTTTIYCRGKNEDGLQIVECSVTVTKTKVSVTGISLDKSTLYLAKGKTETLKATLKPSNATTTDMTWSTTNKNIASVDSNGKVTGVNKGTATITVRSKDGNYTAKCTVEVTNKTIYTNDIYFDDDTLEMAVGESDTLYYTVEPANATDTSVTFKSSNTTVVTVNSKGKVTAVKKGTATITVTSNDSEGYYSDTMVITVY